MTHREHHVTSKRHLNGNAEKMLMDARGKISEGADSALEGMIEMLELAGYQVKKQTLIGKENITTYVKQNPFKSMGFAMVAGSLCALLLKR